MIARPRIGLMAGFLVLAWWIAAASCGGGDERTKFDDWYRWTLESYREHFGDEPPSDLWPPQPAIHGAHRWMDVDTHVPIPRQRDRCDR